MILPPGPAIPATPRHPHGQRAPAVVRYEASGSDPSAGAAHANEKAGARFAAAGSAFLAQIMGKSPVRAARPETAAGAYRMQDAAEVAPRRFKSV